jgi:DNA adenine methylase
LQPSKMEPLLTRPNDRSAIVAAVAQKAISVSNGRFIGLFCDAADVFFAVEPARGVLVDARKPIVAFYEAVQREPDAVHEELQKLIDKPLTERTFNHVRSKWNGKDFGVLFAAKFLYLNRVCAPGTFSVDLGQRFAAQWGDISNPSFPSLENLKQASALLRRMRLYTKDYAYVLRAARKGDVVYVDSPTWGVGISYGGALFAESEHNRLARLLRRASDRGVTVIASNADCEPVRALYEPWADTETIGEFVMISSVGSYMDRRQMSLFG